VTAVVVTVALLGLCAGVAAAPMNALTRINELDQTPATIPGDLDFASPLVGNEIVFDPNSDLPDDSGPRFSLPLNTTLTAPEPPALLLLPVGLACLGILGTLRRLPRLLQNLKKPGRTRRRKVKRELRMMA
jgi:hypothetical protein